MIRVLSFYGILWKKSPFFHGFYDAHPIINLEFHAGGRVRLESLPDLPPLGVGDFETKSDAYWIRPWQKKTTYGGFKHGFYFPFHMGCHPYKIDELHHFSRRFKAPTSIYKGPV